MKIKYPIRRRICRPALDEYPPSEAQAYPSVFLFMRFEQKLFDIS
ncbi:MAG: hypothetical protein WA081_04135 [Desulfosalsimonadaceae bacterium]